MKSPLTPCSALRNVHEGVWPSKAGIRFERVRSGFIAGLAAALAATACNGEVTGDSATGVCAPIGVTSCEAGQLRTCVADDTQGSVWSEATACPDGFCGDANSCGVAVLVAAPVITSPVACETVSTIDSAALAFTVSDLTGIEHFGIDVQAVSNCNELPSGGSVTSYPTTRIAETPSSGTLRLLPPDRWYRVTVEAVASMGFKSNSTYGWFKTAARPTPEPSSLAVGGYHTCAISDTGAASCWGDDERGQLGDGGANTKQVTPVPVAGLSSGMVAITAGTWHTCALLEGGAVKCWGSDALGQLGDGGTLTDQNEPVNVVGLSSGVVAIAAGGAHTCALLDTGGVKCWGSDEFGQLGDDDFGSSHNTPVDVVGLSIGVTSITAGGWHTCALLDTGTVKCWGRDNAGQLGNGDDRVDRATPVDVSGLASDIISIAAGGQHTCALPNTGPVRCWGYNGYGELGDGAVNLFEGTPVDVIGLSSGIFAIAAGGAHTCAVDETGAVHCWGMDNEGQLGDDGVNVDKSTPVVVAGISTGAVAVAAGSLHTCARMATGGILCWGYDLSGQLGHGGTTSYRATAVDVAGLSSGVQNIAAGEVHTCALLASGGIKCFGNNHRGQLGNGGPAVDQSAPVDVVGMSTGVSMITANGWHTCALLNTGGVKCWGLDANGQLGDTGTGIEQLAPVDVVGLTSGVSAVAAGGSHTCALLSTNGLKCWGDDTYGQLGDGGDNVSQHTAVDVVGLQSEVRAVAPGSRHTCALLDTGGVKCWGDNTFGQLGNNDLGVPQVTPVDVFGLASDVIAIATGGCHTCVVLDGGAVKCWGSDDNGQLGDGGTNTDQGAPVDVPALSSGVVAVDLGMHHSCAVLDTGALMCWGSNELGQLGDDNAGTDQGEPVSVVGLASGVTALTAGGWHTCALSSTGGIKCFGEDYSGQVGDGCFGSSRCVPVAVWD